MAISHDTTRAQLRPITNFVPGADGNTRIINKMRTWYWRLTIRATATLAAGPSTIINQGRLAALFQFIGINENGTKYQMDARALAGLSDQLCNGMPAQQHLTSGANGAVNLVDQIFIPCAWMKSSRPWETAWREKDPSAETDIFVTPWGGTGTTGVTDGVGFLVAAGAGTLVISNLTINVVQVFDQLTNVPPLFRPRFDVVQQVITGAGTDLEQLLPVNGLLRAIIAQQDTNVGEVRDIATGFQFRTDQEFLEGYNNDLIMADENLAQMMEFGGNLTVSQIAQAMLGAGAIPGVWPNGAELLRNYQSTGRLTQCLNLLAGSPGFAGPNFRALITGQPSAAAGATTSLVRFSLYKLERIPGVTAATLPAKFGWGV